MSDDFRERLFHWLPRVQQVRDAAVGHPLRSLLKLLEDELERIECDSQTLYDNWFVETCDDERTPLFAELLGDPIAANRDRPLRHRRRWLKQLIDLRRDKGTLETLQRAIESATGWRAVCVEFQQRLGMQQRVDAPEQDRGQTFDVRRRAVAAPPSGPFDMSAHRVDVRSVTSRRGQFNLGNLGVFLWRTTSEPVRDAVPGNTGRPGCFTFHPLGIDTPLYQRAAAWSGTASALVGLPKSACRSSMSPAESVSRPPGPIDPEEFRRRTEEFIGQVESSDISIVVAGNALPATQIISSDLGNWNRRLSPRDPAVARLAAGLPTFLVDVAPGRFALAETPVEAMSESSSGASSSETIQGDQRAEPADLFDLSRLSVTYHSGRICGIGGGGYARWESLTTRMVDDWAPGSDDVPASELSRLLGAWNEACLAQSLDDDTVLRGIIRLNDNRSSAIDVVDIHLPPVGWLALEAADGARPSLVGEREATVIRVLGGGRDNLLVLNGLTIRGRLQIVVPTSAEAVLNVQIRHCTITAGIEVVSPPARRNVAFQAATSGVRHDRAQVGVLIERCLVGPLRLPETITELRIVGSVVDGRGLILPDQAGEQPVAVDVLPGTSDAVADDLIASAPDAAAKSTAICAAGGAEGPPLVVESSTILGGTSVRELVDATDTIFFGELQVLAARLSAPRHCFVLTDVRSPALQLESSEPDAAATALETKAMPRFLSLKFGNPHYAQLAPDCPAAFLSGGRNARELGAFGELAQAERRELIGDVLKEFLPAQLRAGVFLVT